MDAKQAKGLDVVSIDEAKKIGIVDRVFFDPSSRKLVGFTVDVSGRGAFAKQAFGAILGEADSDPMVTGYVRAEDVHALGPDALTLDAEAKLHAGETGPDDGTSIPIDDLIKRKVVTENGTFVGQVSTVEIDPQGLALTKFDVSPGFFKSNTMVPIDLVSTIGPDMIVVADEVCARQEAEAEGEEGERRFVVFEEGLDNVRTDRGQGATT